MTILWKDLEKFEIFEVNLLHRYPNVFRKERTIPFKKSSRKYGISGKGFSIVKIQSLSNYPKFNFVPRVAVLPVKTALKLSQCYQYHRKNSRFCKAGCVFPMVIWSEFRMEQYKGENHWEDAPHVTICLESQWPQPDLSDWYIVWNPIWKKQESRKFYAEKSKMNIENMKLESGSWTVGSI